MAASRVNKKFVVILISVLAALTVGGAGAFYFLVLGNASRLERQGDAAWARACTKAGLAPDGKPVAGTTPDYEAAGKEFKAAERLYSKAVNKDKTNITYIEKWMRAQEKLTPETENEYISKYDADYWPAMWTLASAKRTDAAAYRHCFDTLRRLDFRAQLISRANEVFGTLPKDDKNCQALRVYRGEARLLEYMIAANLKEEEIQEIRKDFEATLAADPANGRAIVGLSAWWGRRSNELADKHDEDGSRDALANSRKVLDDFLVANPRDPRALIARVHCTAEDVQRELLKLTDEKARLAGREKLIADLGVKIAEAAKAIDEIPAGELDIELINILNVAENQYVAGPNRNDGSEALYRKRIEAVPSDFEATLRLALMIAERNDAEKAIPLYERVATMAQMPMGVEGRRQWEARRAARFQQGVNAMRLWVRADPKKTEEKTKWLGELKTYREKLAGLMEKTEDPRLTFLDAYIEFALGNNSKSQKLLLEYTNDMKRIDLEALWLLAEVSGKLDELGRSEQALNLIVEHQPFNLVGLLKLADVRIKLRKYAEVQPLLERAARLDPENKDVANMAATVNNYLDPRRGANVNPVTAAVIQADRLEKDGDADKAYELLEKTLASKPATAADPKTAFAPYLPLIKVVAAKRALRGDKDKAIALVEDALKTFPDDNDLKFTLIGLRENDPIKVKIQIIDASPQLSQTDRALAKYEVLRTTDRKDEAKAQLELARSLEPDNSAIIEYDFLAALDAKDWNAAEKLWLKAKDRDLDRLEGLTFKTRMLVAQGNIDDATRELETVKSKSIFSVEAGRFLAELYIRQGRPAEAVELYRQALAKRPSDRMAALSLIQVLDDLERGPEALDTARQYQNFLGSDLSFVDMWLSLEARYGDREKALTSRKMHLQQQPNNRVIQMALARLLVDLKHFKEAEDLIKRIRTQHDGIDSVTLDAKLHGDQADIPGARKVFEDYIAAAKSAAASDPTKKLTADPYIALARFMQFNEQIDEAEKAYKLAAEIQDPKTLPADKGLGDMYTTGGRLMDAAALYKKIVDAKADTADNLYAKKRIDVLIRARKGAEADEALNALGSAVDKDPMLFLQRSDAARFAGDNARADQLLNEAIAKFPKEPMVYFRRAQANMGDRSKREAVMKDLATAIELRPLAWQVRRARAMMYVQSGEIEKAIADLREAVKNNPGQDDLRITLVRELLLDNRDTDALEVADEVIKKRPQDLGLLVNTADLFREAGREDRALEYYNKAYKLNAQLFVVIPYLSLLQNGKNPNLGRADEVLGAIGGDVIRSSPQLLMARAKQYLKRNKANDGLKDVIAALRAVDPKQSGQIMGWFNELKTTLVNPDDLPTVLKAVDDEHLVPGWTNFFRAGLKLETRNTVDVQKEGIAMLEEIAAKESTPEALAWQSLAALQGKYFQMKDTSNLMRVANAAVKRFPDDANMLNNLAYLIVYNGGSAKEAIPYAEKAIQRSLERNAEAAGIRDTLGWVYLKDGQFGKAESELVRALGLAGGQPVRQTVILHIAELEIARAEVDKKEGRAKEAENRLAQAESLISDCEKGIAISKNAVPGVTETMAELRARAAKVKS